MNIFVLDENPAKAAAAHCDSHVVKMILETTQMLCTVRSLAGNPVADGYKPTHENHPCTRWVSESIGNYNWTHRLLFWLHAEYELRYEKVHAAKRLFTPIYLSGAMIAAPGAATARTPFVFVGPPECWRDTTVESYRALYRLKQTTMKRPMRWTKVQRPEWMDIV